MKKKNKIILILAILIPISFWVWMKIVVFGYFMLITVGEYALVDAYPARILNDTDQKIYICPKAYPEQTDQWFTADCQIIDVDQYADFVEYDIQLGYFIEAALPADEQSREFTQGLNNYCLGPKYFYSEEEKQRNEEEYFGDFSKSKEFNTWETIIYELNVFKQYKELDDLAKHISGKHNLNHYYLWSEAIDFDPGDMTPGQVTAECEMLRDNLYNIDSE